MSRSFRHILVLLLSTLVIGGSVVISHVTNSESADILALRIDTATWESSDHRLIVKGVGPARQQVTIRNAGTQAILGTIRIRESEWKLELRNPSPVPCRVSAETQGQFQDRTVQKAPNDCGGVTNLPPDGTISPSSNVTVTVGGAVEFSGQGSDPDANLPLKFAWNFGGGATNSAEQNPGSVSFSQVGTFTVSLIVTDNLGLADPTPAEIVVSVTPKGTVSSVPQQPFILTGQYQVLPANDLGMHCGDLGNSVFSMLPPFNRVVAQVIQKGSTGANRPRILDNTQVSVEYSAASNPVDPAGGGSINSTSQNSNSVYKTDFWNIHPTTGNPIVQDLFGLNPPPDEGLAFGQRMPGRLDPYKANDPQAFNSFWDALKAFVAPGIPLTPTDDTGRHNSYPLMRIQAKNGGGTVLATTDGVVPVSEEVNCAGCHAREGESPIATERPGVPYMSANSQTRFDIEFAGKINILRLHDIKHGTLLDKQQPVLCARCHYSAALDLAGDGPQGEQLRHGPMSKVLHQLHGKPHPLRPNDIPEIIPSSGPMEKNCFQCHPGKITQCFRGAMFKAGLQCHDCHASMNAIAGIFKLKTGDFRRHWLDEPKCGSCHAGDALNHLGSDIILRKAFDPADPAGTPVVPTNTRFAENPETLYRNSKGHGGVFCEGCHGSPHAIWPNQNPLANDNVAAKQLQGHSGPIAECSTCHQAGSLGLTLNGPHGLHPVNDPFWNKEHKELFEHNRARCQTCHGVNLEGTVLSKTAADRTLRAKEEQPDGTKNIFLAKGTQVSCTLCHKLPE